MASRVHIVLAASAVVSATANGSAFDTQRMHGPVAFVLAATADVAGTSLDVDIEAYDPLSGTWNVLGSFTQIGGTTPSRERIIVTQVPEQQIRGAWTIVGTSYTFSLSAAGLTA